MNNNNNTNTSRTGDDEDNNDNSNNESPFHNTAAAAANALNMSTETYSTIASADTTTNASPELADQVRSLNHLLSSHPDAIMLGHLARTMQLEGGGGDDDDDDDLLAQELADLLRSEAMLREELASLDAATPGIKRQQSVGEDMPLSPVRIARMEMVAAAVASPELVKQKEEEEEKEEIKALLESVLDPKTANAVQSTLESPPKRPIDSPTNIQQPECLVVDVLSSGSDIFPNQNDLLSNVLGDSPAHIKVYESNSTSSSQGEDDDQDEEARPPSYLPTKLQLTPSPPKKQEAEAIIIPTTTLSPSRLVVDELATTSGTFNAATASLPSPQRSSPSLVWPLWRRNKQHKTTSYAALTEDGAVLPTVSANQVSMENERVVNLQSSQSLEVSSQAVTVTEVASVPATVAAEPSTTATTTTTTTPFLWPMFRRPSVAAGATTTTASNQRRLKTKKEDPQALSKVSIVSSPKLQSVVVSTNSAERSAVASDALTPPMAEVVAGASSSTAGLWPSPRSSISPSLEIGAASADSEEEGGGGRRGGGDEHSMFSELGGREVSQFPNEAMSARGESLFNLSIDAITAVSEHSSNRQHETDSTGSEQLAAAAMVRLLSRESSIQESTDTNSASEGSTSSPDTTDSADAVVVDRYVPQDSQHTEEGQSSISDLHGVAWASSPMNLSRATAASTSGVLLPATAEDSVNASFGDTSIQSTTSGRSILSGHLEDSHVNDTDTSTLSVDSPVNANFGDTSILSTTSGRSIVRGHLEGTDGLDSSSGEGSTTTDSSASKSDAQPLQQPIEEQPQSANRELFPQADEQQQRMDAAAMSAVAKIAALVSGLRPSKKVQNVVPLATTSPPQVTSRDVGVTHRIEVSDRSGELPRPIAPIQTRMVDDGDSEQDQSTSIDYMAPSTLLANSSSPTVTDGSGEYQVEMGLSYNSDVESSNASSPIRTIQARSGRSSDVPGWSGYGLAAGATIPTGAATSEESITDSTATERFQNSFTTRVSSTATQVEINISSDTEEDLPKDTELTEEETEHARRRLIRCYGLLCVLIVLVVGMWIGIGWQFYRMKNPSEEATVSVTTGAPTVLPLLQPTVAPQLEPVMPVVTDVPSATPSLALVGMPVALSPTVLDNDLFDLLVSVSPDNGAALQDESSPQYQAFAWLSQNAALSVYSQRRKLQRYALATLYFSTDGVNWAQNASWLSNANECSWYTRSSQPCGALSDYQNLELYYNDLQGQIPPEIGLLTSLRRIQISGGPDRSLSGSIPTTIVTLTKLTELRLQNNDLTGTIPRALGQLGDLFALDLSYNRLTGNIISEIGNLSELEQLHLSSNKLSGTIPLRLRYNRYLSSLVLDNNLLSGRLDPSIGQLTRLQTVYLENNRLTSILPASIGNLAALKVLSLGGNSFSGTLPSTLGQLTSLMRLSMPNNNLTGKLPDSLRRLVQLTEELDVSFNFLSGTIPLDLGNIDGSLRVLKLDHNALTGNLPVSFDKFTRLNFLSLQSNSLSGTVPSSVCSLFNKTLPSIFVDCDQLNCPCCNYCCTDNDSSSSSCECRYVDTSQEWMCYY
jgi:Leucine-rich repeat (LRR) protein